MYVFRLKTRVLPLAAAGCLLAAGAAGADQCLWLEKAHAAKALVILAEQPKVIEYCEPCGGAPGEPFVAAAVAVATPEGDYREVSINGKAVDLAYTYVETSPDKYENLAMLVGCPVTGVSPSLAVTGEEPPAEPAVAAPVLETPAPAEPVVAVQVPAAPAAVPENRLVAEFRTATRRAAGMVHFYRHGSKIGNTTLRVFDARGNLVKRISIGDRTSDNREKRRVGTWDLTDMNSRPVRPGAYSVIGMVVTRDGKREETALTVEVR